MPQVHPTAILDGDVTLAEDVSVGPHCVVDGAAGPITIGAGTRLIGSAYLTGPLTIGEHNTIYPFVTLGYPPQDLKWDPNRPGAGVVIGDRNTFRESVTIHRATSDETPTHIGNDNYLMACSHAGHDCSIANSCIIANAVLLAGFVSVADRVIIGGATSVHQFVRIGRGSMLTGSSGLAQDLPPFFMLTGFRVAGGINLVGLRRSKTPPDVIEDVRWTYRTLYRRSLSYKSALEVLRERADRPMIREYIDFLENSKRGICPGYAKHAARIGEPESTPEIR
jgi:UDP-N-acetylglucosamine acyltransferase